MHFDLLIVGGGPAGLAAAIRAKQAAQAQEKDIHVCLIDKGSEIGAHILSGAIIDVSALTQLIPDWQQRQAPLHTQVTKDSLLFLSPNTSWQIPGWLKPACLDNRQHYLGSLGQLCRWLAQQAEALGVEIYPGFAAQAVIQDTNGAILGVQTGDMGRLKNGQAGPGFTPGIALTAAYTLIAEGARGHLGQQVETLFNLRKNADPQTFSLGIKELWQIPASQHQCGLALHTAGWPLGNTPGGGFLYHYDDNLVAIGLVTSLAYRNPWLSPFEEFQRLKTHRSIRHFLANGERLAYGARTLANGGLQSLPELIFPGGALIGDVAGFLNPARLKGIDGAMFSGMLAAEAAADAILKGEAQTLLTAYPKSWSKSSCHQALYAGRNFKPGFKFGLAIGSVLAGLDQNVLHGHAPWTLHNKADYAQTKHAEKQAPISYPKPDGIVSFDLMSSVFLSNTQHEENQPCHLQLADPNRSIRWNLPHFAAPETRYCPAGVYEIDQSAAPQLKINAANCLHCKACDIKDPTQNIHWTPPQGGEGPLYTQM